MGSVDSLRPGDIPDEFFTAVAFLIPYLNRVAQECGIDIGSLLVMTHLTIAGKIIKGHRTMLRQDLTALLLARGFSEAGISRLLQGLEANELIRRGFVPADVRQELFEPSDRVNTLSIILTPEGEQKIADFKSALRAHFGNWLSKESEQQPWLSRWVRKLLPRAVKLAQSLIQQIAEKQIGND